MIFSVNREGRTSRLNRATQTTLSNVNLLEVGDFQEWIVKNPSLLSFPDNRPDPIIVGKSVYLGGMLVDIMAIDRDGTIIVCETKRGGDDPLYQALKYTGVLSSLEPDDLISLVKEKLGERFSDFESTIVTLDEDGNKIDLRAAWSRRKRKFRIILFAEEFDHVVLKTSQWLSEKGIDIVLLQAKVYSLDGHLLFQPNRLLPSIDSVVAYHRQLDAKIAEEKGTRTRNMFLSYIRDGRIKIGEDIFDQYDKIIGIVEEAGIRRIQDNSVAVNLWQLTGAGSWSAKVKRNDIIIALGDLTPPAPPDPEVSE